MTVKYSQNAVVIKFETIIIVVKSFYIVKVKKAPKLYNYDYITLSLRIALTLMILHCNKGVNYLNYA